MSEDRLYEPSNGTEGEWFDSHYCAKCSRDLLGRKLGDGGCKILLRALTKDVSDPEYPREWTYNDADFPTCTAFSPIVKGESAERVKRVEDPNQMEFF